MFIAMNRFRVVPGRENDFEAGWQSRERHLQEFDGFVQFALLRGEDEGEYISHTTWAKRADFVVWTESEAFKASHARGLPGGTLAGHPQIGLYESVIVEKAP